MSFWIKRVYNGRKAITALIKRRLSTKRIPARVSFLVTKYCNLRCVYCYASSIINSKEIREPNLSDLKNIVDQIYKAGCRWVDILGGEPLIRDDIEEIVDYIHGKGMFIEITTNGYFVQKRIGALKKLDHVCISLDGNKESNDLARGNGSFEKIAEGIEFGVKNGLNIRVHATLCKKTMSPESLRFLADFCNRLKIKFNYSENGIPGVGRLDQDFLLSEEETMKFYENYKNLKKKGYPVISSDVAVSYAKKWPFKDRTIIYKKDLDKIPRGCYYPCQLGRNQCFINVNGDVYACTKKWGYGKNLYEVGFQAAWDHLAILDCVACKELGTIEQSLITNLNPKALCNALTNFVL
ncbi:MAG: radical SAM protein [Candidatus Omnitrophota bacterium]|nr:radical SAM protein [Candidatus Omnitrophota bacterium]